MDSTEESDTLIMDVHTNNSTTTPNPRAVICQYCKGDFAPSRLANHERDCAQRTIEQRQKATDARDLYREKYSNAAHAKAGTSPRERYKQSVAQPSTLDEPVVSARRKRMSHEQREHSLAHQRWYNKNVRKRSHHAKAAQLAREVQKASIMMNNKRVQITVSLDWETVRALLVELGPNIAIDKIELV